MRRPFSPISVVSGALSFGLLAAQASVAVQVLPHLLELLKSAPRLAIAGFLGLVLFPGLVVVIVHHVGHQLLDQYDRGTKRNALLPTTESWWAGALAWLVIYGTTILTRLTYLLINPPPPEEDAFTVFTQTLEQHASLSHSVSLYALLWVATATSLFELERRSRKA